MKNPPELSVRRARNQLLFTARPGWRRAACDIPPAKSGQPGIARAAHPVVVVLPQKSAAVVRRSVQSPVLVLQPLHCLIWLDSLLPVLLPVPPELPALVKQPPGQPRPVPVCRPPPEPELAQASLPPAGPSPATRPRAQRPGLRNPQAAESLRPVRRRGRWLQAQVMWLHSSARAHWSLGPQRPTTQLKSAHY